MMALYIFMGFFITIISIGVGYMFGYQAGYKSEKTLKQQIGRLKQTVQKHNKSAQLKEFTTEELKLRADWDFRAKLAEVTGQDITTPDTRTNDDPQSIENTF